MAKIQSTLILEGVKRGVDSISNPARIEIDLPVEGMFKLARREGNAKRPIYEIHKWWARRLGSNFRMILIAATAASRISDEELWRRFYAKSTPQDLLVFDPFLGGGTTVVEASKLGFKAGGSDIDPVACFVSRLELGEVDLDLVRRGFEQIAAAVERRIRRYYTVGHGASEREIISYFWVLNGNCGKCGERHELHPHYVLHAPKGGSHQIAFCSGCHKVARLPASFRSFTCDSCGLRTNIASGPMRLGKLTCTTCGGATPLSELLAGGAFNDRTLFAKETVRAFDSKREFTSAGQSDLEIYERASRDLKGARNQLPLPLDEIPRDNRFDPRPLTFGVRLYRDLFNDRQKLCLGLIAAEIRMLSPSPERELIAGAFSDSLASNNMLCAYAFGYRKLTPLFGLHAYRLVARPVEGNVWGVRYGRGSFVKCVHKAIRAREYAANPYEYGPKAGQKTFTGEKVGGSLQPGVQEWLSSERGIVVLNQSSANLNAIPDQSVDLVITDPPYFDNLPYSEYAHFFHVWLRMISESLADAGPSDRAISGSLASNVKGPDAAKAYAAGMSGIFRESSRILKRPGLMTVTFHHTRPEAWLALATAARSADFRVTKVIPLLAEGRSGFHSANGNIKWDSLLVMRKNGHNKRDRVPLDRIVRDGQREVSEWLARFRRARIPFSPADRLSLISSIGLKNCVNYREVDVGSLVDLLVDKKALNSDH